MKVRFQIERLRTDGEWTTNGDAKLAASGNWFRTIEDARKQRDLFQRRMKAVGKSYQLRIVKVERSVVE